MPFRFRYRTYRMGYITALLLLATYFRSSFGDEFCPSASVIAPCACDGEGINCMKVRTDSELQRIFRSIPKPWKFRGVWIQTTDTTVLPAGMFKGIEVQAFHIEINKIHTVQVGAFSGSEQSCYSLSVFGNHITDFPFDDIKKFEYLQSFNAGRNRLTSIPEKAFYGHKYLKQILLPENMISVIGAYAFGSLPQLQRLDLLHNRLVVLSPFALAMTGHNPQLMVNIANCSISSIAPTTFNGMTPRLLNLALNKLQHLEEQAFFPMAQRLAKAGGVIDVSANPLSCLGCQYRWVVLNKNVLQTMLPGFRCTDGRSLQSLQSWNIMCNFP